MENEIKINNDIIVSSNVLNINNDVIASSNVLNISYIKNNQTVTWRPYTSDEMILQAINTNGETYKYSKTEDYYVYFLNGSDKRLVVKCNFHDNCEINWSIDGDNAFNCCEQALKRIEDMKKLLDKISKDIYDKMLEQK